MLSEKDLKMHDLIDVVITVLDARDPYTFAHSWRVAAIAERIAIEMNIDEKWIDRIHIAAHLHDIGKVGVPDYVLNKVGKLSSEEFDLMKSHSVIGYNILRKLPLLEEISLYVRHHHERWDGNGYPDGLFQKNIPLGSRIIAVADSYDALTSNRYYRLAVNADLAFAEINRCSGSQFCPETVEVFNSLRDEISPVIKKINEELCHFAFSSHEFLMPIRNRMG